MLPAARRRHLFAAWLLACATALPAFAHTGVHSAAATEAVPAAAPRTVTGVVEALVVDDRTTGRVLRFPQVRQADGSVVSLAGSVVDALNVGDAVVLTGIPNGDGLEVATINRQTPTTPSAAGVVATAAGTFLVAHSDDFDTGTSRYRYDVQADDGRSTRLDVAGAPAVLQSGMRVEVTGRPGLDGAVQPSTIVITAAAPAAPKVMAKATTIHSTLVVMANFSDTVPPALTQAQAQAVMTSNSGSVSNYYDEVSFGQHKLNVTVMPAWVNLAMAKPSCIDTVLGTFTNAANTAATAAGYNPSNYDFVVYVFAGGGCAWSGLGYVGYPHLAYINGAAAFATSVIAHEMGHNFGLLHAGSLRCTGAIIGGACTAAEYGDAFSAMGNQHAGHFNVQQKRILGWISAGTVPTHLAGTATYTLTPIETSGGGTYGVKVPTPNTKRTYYVEYRQPLGFDALWSWTAGAQVRVASPFEVTSGSDDTELLDMTPGTSSFNDAALTAGSTFTDPTYPISITVVSSTPTSVTVKVTAPSGSNPTTTAVSSSVNPSTTGTAVTFSASVTGTSPTGTVSFTDAGTPIGSCGTVALAGSGNTRTATCTINSLASGAHNVVAAYGGDTTNATSSSTVLWQNVLTAGWLGFQGGFNQALGSGSAVAAGSNNVASAQASFVGAGTSNTATGISSLVIGGFDNHATGQDSLVGAGAGNQATGVRSVVVGGGYNLASGPWSFIGGGGRETGSGAAGASAQDHVVVGKWSAIIGGQGNRAATSAAQTGATVAGGEQNQAINTDATVGGGAGNTASALIATVAGGQGNSASSSGAAVGGGVTNAASGQWATVAGGNANTASGNYGFAAGRQAKATHAGSLILADSSAFNFNSAAVNEFAVRAVGGARVVTAINGSGTPTAGVSIPAGGGSWTTLSDRAAKQDLTAVDGESVLARLAAMPVYTWRYKTEVSGALHLGPTAQDFYAAFGLGDSDTRITMVDADGVALAAVRQLQGKVARNEAAIAARAARIAALRARLTELEVAGRDVAALKAALAQFSASAHNPGSRVRVRATNP